MPLGRVRTWYLWLALVGCAAPFTQPEGETESFDIRKPLEGLATGSAADTLSTLLVRRDSLDRRVLRLVQERVEAHQALLDFARNPSGDHLPLVGNDAAGARGGMADRFRQEAKAAMTAQRMAEHEKLLEKRLRVAVEERDGVCSELSARLGPEDVRRCTG